MAINNTIHRIEFKRPIHIVYGKLYRINRTTTRINTILTKINKTAERVEL